SVGEDRCRPLMFQYSLLDSSRTMTGTPSASAALANACWPALYFVIPRPTLSSSKAMSTSSTLADATVSLEVVSFDEVSLSAACGFESGRGLDTTIPGTQSTTSFSPTGSRTERGRSSRSTRHDC